jgi:hypothetical protein
MSVAFWSPPPTPCAPFAACQPGPERPFSAAPAGVAHFADLKRTECAAAWLLSAGIVSIGFYPAPLLRLMASSLASWPDRLESE